MPHPDEGLIHAWLDGELDATEAARVQSLVDSDAEWAAAVAEARGLVAATSRIVGTLDRVPANVIPAVRPARIAGRQWIWRAAAAIVLVAGSAVVLQKESPVLPVAVPPVAVPPVLPVTTASAPAPVPVSAPAAAEQAPAQKRVELKSNLQPKELDAVKKQTENSRDKAAASSLADANAVGSVNRPAASAPAAPSAAGGAALSQPLASQRASAAKAEAKVAAAPSCFEQREPADSAKRIIRLDAAALSDSIRLEKLTLSGDTLAAVNAKLKAIRVRCP